MNEINQIELQKLKYIINLNKIAFQKLNSFSSQAVDPQIKQFFTKSAQEKLNENQKLIAFLEQ